MIQLANNKQIPITITEPERSVIVVGGAGSGKTFSVFQPYIQHVIQHQEPFILYDYKTPELSKYAQTLQSRVPSENRNLSIRVVSFETPQVRINPISPKYIEEVADARASAEVLYFNLNHQAIKRREFWDDNAINIITAMIWFLSKHSPENCTIPCVRDWCLKPINEIIELFSTDDDCARICSSLFSLGDARSTLGNIASSLQTPLARLISPKIDAVLGGDDFDFVVNRSNTGLIIEQNSQNPEVFSPCISLTIAQALRQMNRPNRQRSHVIIDELPTIFIPGLENYPAVTRSRKIAFVIGIQDFAQIDKAYSRDIRNALISNLAYQFYGRVSNQDTINYVVNFLGKTERDVQSTSQGYNESQNQSGGSSGSSHSTSWSKQMRNIIDQQDILRFVPGQFVVINPTPLYGADYFGIYNLKGLFVGEYKKLTFGEKQSWWTSFLIFWRIPFRDQLFVIRQSLIFQIIFTITLTLSLIFGTLYIVYKSYLEPHENTRKERIKELDKEIDSLLKIQ